MIYKSIDYERKQFLLDLYKRMNESITKTQSSIIQSIMFMIEELQNLKFATETFYRDQRLEIEKIIEDLSENNREILAPGLKTSEFSLEDIANFMKTNY